MSANFDKIVGESVHFQSDSMGTIMDGVIVGAWLENEPSDDENVSTVRVAIHCYKDNKYREAWLTNCTWGYQPRAKKEDQ